MILVHTILPATTLVRGRTIKQLLRLVAVEAAVELVRGLLLV
jgi:hypothetical protein